MKKLTLAAAALCIALGGTVARAQDAGALLDLLVKKRLISDQEAEEVRSELVKESASTAAGKWKLSAPITELELYGDVRLRYEYRGGRTPSDHTDNPNDWYERERERYRLRVGLRGTLADDWFFGLRLETSDSSPLNERDFRSGISAVHSQKSTTESLWVRHISVTRVSRTSNLQAAECHSRS